MTNADNTRGNRKMKKLYLISQNVNNDYDTYSDAVIFADTKEEAKHFPLGDIGKYGSWASPENVKVEYLGIATKIVKKGVVCSSFHAG